MNHCNFLDDPWGCLPSGPNLNHTLLLIETNRYLPVTNSLTIDQPIPLPLEDEVSLEEQLSKEKNNTSTSLRKKKGGCTCKKTNCLKMYCECFREGRECTEECSCYGCHNDHHHAHEMEKARQSVGKAAGRGAKQEGKGCNCRKSQCQKRYCECFNAGVACGAQCRCVECANGSCGSHSQSPPSIEMELLEREVPELGCQKGLLEEDLFCTLV